MQLEKLGPYRIGRQLGRGGMGAVFEGIDERTGERVAVKVLSVGLSRDEGFRERFEAEIETLRKLRHEHIVRLLGFGEEQGALYYAMDLIEGTSLEEMIRVGKRLPWPDAVRMVVQVCQALRHAHDRGIVHRDIKPANLLLTREGNVKLADFGIAKLFGSSGMTAAGGAIGTAEYMAPEQADGRLVSHRADLYSLGAVFYGMLAGRPPFVAKSIIEMLQLQRFAQPEPLRRFVPDVPEEIEAIVMQLLEKDPERRPANATVLARRLEATALGLSLRDKARREQQAGSHDGEFDLGPPTNVVRTNPTGNVMETRLGTQVIAGDALPPEEQVTQVTEAAPGSVAERAPSPPKTRYVSVGEADHLDEEDHETPSWRVFRPQTLVLVFAIILTGMAVWYFLQPPDADALFNRITQKIRSGGMEDGLLDAESDVEAFLKYHPNDKRTKQVEDYLRDIMLIRKERQFRARLRMQAGVSDLSPPELAYVQAMRDIHTHPDVGVAKLHALLTMYEEASDLTSEGLLAVRLARKQLQRHQRIAEEYVTRQRKNLREQLARAEKLASTQPQRARELWQAIVELHRRDDWAQDQVRAAEERLMATEAEAAPTADPTVPDGDAPEALARPVPSSRERSAG